MKIIHQVYISKNNELPSNQILEKIDNIKNLYSDYEYKLWTNDSIREFLKESFNQSVLETYDAILPYAFKADLARYCILYKYGGYYFDVAITLEEKIEYDHDVVLYENTFDKSVFGVEEWLDVIENDALFFKNPGHPLLKEIIKHIENNVYELNYGHHPLCITGPLLLHTVYHKLNDNSIKLGKIKNINGKFVGILDNNITYYRKDIKFAHNLEALGCKGTNDYEKMWFAGNIYKLKFSYVMITNNKNPEITKASIKSLCETMTNNDELIVVGDVEFLNNLVENVDKNIILYHDMYLATGGRVSHSRNKGIDISTGNIIVHIDDDILFPENFQSNILKYIRYNMPRNQFDTFNTKFVLSDGARWWDRAIYLLEKDETYMVPYESIDDNLFYPAALLIWKKSIAKTIRWDENHLYYDPDKINEDVKLSYDLKNAGYKIKIDINTYAIHFDQIYCVIECDGKLIGIKKKDKPHNIKRVSDSNYNSEIKRLIKKYYL